MSDRQWYAERLDDLTLLASAVEIEGLLAVPIGGKRRAGFVNVDGASGADLAIAELSKHPGFPNLRTELGDEEVADLVRWGDDEPPTPGEDAPDSVWVSHEIATGNLYGYSDKAINRWIRQQK